MVPSSMGEEQTMTPLRARMIEDMKLAGLAARTQEVYLQAVGALAKHYRRSPEGLSPWFRYYQISYLRHARPRAGHPRLCGPGIRCERGDAHGSSPWAEGPRVKPGHDDHMLIAPEASA
jgi:hypothetical protein